MNEDRYAKYGAATGIVFVILLVVGFLIVTPTSAGPRRTGRMSGPATTPTTRMRSTPG